MTHEEIVQEMVDEWLDAPKPMHELDPEADASTSEDRLFLPSYIRVHDILGVLERKPGWPKTLSGHTLVAQAIKARPDFEKLGLVRRMGRQARWYCRRGKDNGKSRVIPAPEGGNGATSLR